MERQREREQAKEISKELQEKTERELEELRKELVRLRELKKQKVPQKQADQQEQEQGSTESSVNVDEVENKLNKIDGYLTRQMEIIREKTGDKNIDEQYTDYIESELKVLEKQIVGEEGLVDKQISPCEKLLNDYPWLEEKRYEFMFMIPDKKERPSDYESWKEEWSKVMFDYAKYAILHVIYLRQLNTQKPFSNFQDREGAIKEIAQKLIDQKLAIWVNKKQKDQIRIYWKTLEVWADDIYNWAFELGKMEPIMTFEIKESEQEFSTLPDDDLEQIFKILVKKRKAVLLKLEDGEISFKIKID